MNDTDVRISFRQGVYLHGVACVLFVSGGLAAWYDLLEAAGRDGVLAPSFRTWSLKVHGASALLFLIALGALVPTHIQRAWAARRNRVNGVVFASALIVLIVTGYGLYYFGDEALREVARWIHLSVGLVEPAFLGLHIVLGRRTRSALDA
jgi:hypothetical protein